MTSPLYIAVDLGAGSGRIFLVGPDPDKLLFEEIHRFQYPPKEEGGNLRWDFSHIFENIVFGLKRAGSRARELHRSIHSVGVDSWAVDYGLLDADGGLIANPICYRDRRTKNAMAAVFAVVSRIEIFERTGIQFLDFNTIYQLYSEGEEDLSKAAQLLLLPDLINFFLTGNAVAEYTNATTTQMVNVATGNWDLELLGRLGIPTHLLLDIVPAGTDLGELKPEISKETELCSVRVIAPATHDTASAVAAAPLSDGTAYISSGTWSLIGIERNDALINDEVAFENFTNEGGAFGSIRFLKNVMGLWIFESCRREWQAAGLDLSYEEISREVGLIDKFQAFIFPDDERFLKPASMIGAIREQLEETGQNIDESPAAVSKVIFDSLAFRYASVLRTIERLTGRRLEGIQVLGGGGHNRYLNQMTANASGLNAEAGLTEATVIGNVLVQAIASGRFASLAEARAYVRENSVFEEFAPQRSIELDEARHRFSAIEGRFEN